MRWLRLYDDVLDDPKVQRLRADVFKIWINILCIASKHGGNLPDDGDIAFALRLPIGEAEGYIEELVSAGLIDHAENGIRCPHNWSGRQYPSDSSAERMRRHRDRKKAKTVDANSDGANAGEPPEDSEAYQRGFADGLEQRREYMQKIGRSLMYNSKQGLSDK